MRKKSILSTLSVILVALVVLFSFPITAGASDTITDLKIEPITVIEGTNGLTDCNENFFEYTLEDKLNYTVTFADGEVVSGSGYMFEHNGEYYNFEIETDQSKNNIWTAGNTYNYTVRAIGFESQGEVTIEKAQKGDANLDGDVDITDATYIQMYLAQHIEMTSFEWRISDVNDDYDVNIMDVTHIQREIAKLS